MEAVEAEAVRVFPELREALEAPASESLPGGTPLPIAIHSSPKIPLPVEAEAREVMEALEALAVEEERGEPVEFQDKEQVPSPWSIAALPVVMAEMAEMVEMEEEELEELEACLLAPLWAVQPPPAMYWTPIHSQGAALQGVEALEEPVTAIPGQTGSLEMRETATSSPLEVLH